MSSNTTAGRVLVTGATGLLGSHIVERLIARGHRVRALARPGSRTEFLEGLGVEILRGDLTDPAACDRAVEDVSQVFHCAAKVGDWGSWREFQVGCIDATRTLAQASARAGIGRFVHISSTSAYGHPPDQPRPIDETAELGQNVWVLDYYTRSKVECERLLWDMSAAGKLPLTVIRPSWLFGERDRTTIPRLIQEFRWQRVSIVGKGDNPLSAVYAGVVADAAILAANDPHSVGEAYNITSHARITQREFLDMLADALGVPRVTSHYPFWYAFHGGLSLEIRERMLLSKKPPRVTRYGAWLLGRYLEYSTEKARTKLGWAPALTYEESLERTIRWFMADEPARVPHDPMPTLVRVGSWVRRLRRAGPGPGVDRASALPREGHREPPAVARPERPR
jgi:nucleoside-diphosphate-sugar epimerase